MSYTPAADLLADKVILVTGAGDGIGREASLSYARHGATVILLGRTQSKLESVYDEITALDYPEPAIVPMELGGDIHDPVIEMAGALEANYGRLDGLLHNAALLGERVPIQNADPIEWSKVMQVNVNAVFLLTRYFLPLLEQSPAASVVFTSSSVGASPRAFWGAYAVSKCAMEGFARLLVDEMENISDIRFNILNPGATRTSMRASAYPGEDPASLKTPADLMPLYLYLMGDDSRQDNGKTFTADWLEQRA